MNGIVHPSWKEREVF